MWGLTFDSQGRIWINDSGSGSVLRFDPISEQLLRFYLPDGGNGYYIATAGTQAWAGDAINGRLLRLDADQNQMDWWQLPPTSAPNDLAVDSYGNVWYTDSTLSQIGRLNPHTDANNKSELTTYPLPAGNTANMLTISRGKVWYSASATEVSSFGSLNLTSVSDSLDHPTKNSGPADFTTVTLDPVPDSPVDVRHETAHWGSNNVSLAAGGSAYDMPPGAQSWGIAVTNEGWIVDKGRQVLVRFPVSNPNPGNFRVYVPAITR
jgi:streptogramin lyase